MQSLVLISCSLSQRRRVRAPVRVALDWDRASPITVVKVLHALLGLRQVAERGLRQELLLGGVHVQLLVIPDLGQKQ